MNPGWTYRVHSAETLDGDTVRLKVDLGFGITMDGIFRLAGIDTPEKRPLKSRKAAEAAEKRLGELISRAINLKSLVVCTEKGDTKGKYGRYLAWLFCEGEQTSFNDTLVSEGHAKYYDGGYKQGVRVLSQGVVRKNRYD